MRWRWSAEKFSHVGDWDWQVGFCKTEYYRSDITIHQLPVGHGPVEEAVHLVDVHVEVLRWLDDEMDVPLMCSPLWPMTYMSTEINTLTFLRKAFLFVFWLKILDLWDMSCVNNILYSHASLAFTLQMSICMVFFIEHVKKLAKASRFVKAKASFGQLMSLHHSLP